MPSWYYDQDAFHKTPSIQDGIDYETECAYRREGARFIMDIGTQMDLGCNTMATGVVFFHRFYMFHSFVTFPRFVTACCCIFLAGKVEETPKKCKDIIKIAKSLLNEEAFASFGVDPKEEVMTLEKILLKTIKFDFKVEHPYYYLIKFAKHLKGDKNKLQKMVQMAWTFINDSLCTSLCLQWEPEIIAIALMYLAGKLSKFKVISWYHKKPHHTKWWDMFVENLPMPTLEDICHQVLDLYSTVKDQPQEVQIPSQSIKKNSDIKSENPVELEKICSQQIQVKTEEKSSICNPREAKEVFSNSNPIKHEPPIDLTLAVNIKKEPEFPQEHDQPKPKMMLHVAEWASVSASAVMSPGTYSVISPSFPTPNFLVSPVSIGSFNNRFNESTIHGNVNFNKNLPENCQQSKNASTTLFSNQNSVNSNDVTRHTDQSPNLNNLRNNLPLDNCRGNLPISGREFDIFNDNLPKCTRGFDNFNDNIFKSTRGFDNYNDNLLKGSRGFDNCDKLLEGSRGFGNCNDNLPKSNRGFDNFNDNVPKSNRGFDNCNNDLPFRSRGFNECEESVPFRNRGFDNVIEYSLDDNYNCKIADFSKNYQSRDMLIQDYQDSKNLCDRFKYPAKMRNDRDPRTNSRDHPYPIPKNDFCVNPFSEPSNSYENTIDLQKYRCKRSERRFRNSKRFRGPTNN